jgi:uncharacterized surface protein with fasciclin (FAS1) repeats
VLTDVLLKTIYISTVLKLITNVAASNGTVHAIDKVMLLQAQTSLHQLKLLQGEVYSKPELTFLVAAVVKSGLAGTLSDPSANFTIYAPAAFIAGFSK